MSQPYHHLLQSLQVVQPTLGWHFAVVYNSIDHLCGSVCANSCNISILQSQGKEMNLCMCAIGHLAVGKAAMTIVYEREELLEQEKRVSSILSYFSCPVLAENATNQERPVVGCSQQLLLLQWYYLTSELRRRLTTLLYFSFPILVITLNESNTASAYDD